MSEEKTYCGFIAIVGRPNVGKSTLLNNLLGQKISITSRKAQTTRHRIVGIHTEGAYQAIYVDTPGLHMEEKRAINRLMNKAASSSIGDVELVIFVVEGTRCRNICRAVICRCHLIWWCRFVAKRTIRNLPSIARSVA